MAFRRTGEQLDTPVSDEWAQRLGNSVPDWPAFPDSADALARLARHYKLIILSNVHRAGSPAATSGCAATSPRSSPPRTSAPTSRRRTTSARSTPRSPSSAWSGRALLHVAQSLFHDHVPAKREGLPSVWINRRHDRPGWGATPHRRRSGPSTWSSRRWASSRTRSTAPSPDRQCCLIPPRRWSSATRIAPTTRPRIAEAPVLVSQAPMPPNGPSAWSTSSSAWWTSS